MRFFPVRAGSPVRSQQGFSLVELMMVVGIIAVTLAVTLAVNPQFIRSAKADSGVVQALEVLRSARDMAVSQRRNMRLSFPTSNTIEILRENLGANGVVTSLEVVRTAQLESRLRFLLVAGVPDTPDGFGNANALAFGSTVRVFTSEGTFVDANGDPMNGTVFLAVPDDPSSARAITIFGPTALLRAWRWNGSQWVE